MNFVCCTQVCVLQATADLLPGNGAREGSKEVSQTSRLLESVMTRIITLLAALLSTLFVGCAHVTKTPAPRSVIESELPTPNMADMAQHLFDESLDHFGGVEGLRRELADLEAEGETPFVVVTLYHH